MASKCNEILRQVQTVIIGKDEILAKVLMAILSGGHILLEDVPGVGKTTLALAFAKTLGIHSKRMQFTSDSMPSDVIGFSVYDKAGGALAYKPGAAMTNLLLADEINRTSSKTQSALLEVMEEGHITLDGVTRPVPQPFIVIATQNPVGSAGTQVLPPAQLDRFMIRLHLGYPEFADEMNLLKDRHTANPLDSVRQVADKEALLKMQKEAVAVHMADSLYEYVTRLSRATREHAMITLGLSSRGALAVCRMAKAHAYMEGRDYAVPEDVAAIFADVSGHRVILSPKAKMTETSASSVIESVLASVPMPAAGRGE